MKQTPISPENASKPNDLQQYHTTLQPLREHKSIARIPSDLWNCREFYGIAWKPFARRTQSERDPVGALRSRLQRAGFRFYGISWNGISRAGFAVSLAPSPGRRWWNHPATAPAGFKQQRVAPVQRVQHDGAQAKHPDHKYSRKIGTHKLSPINSGGCAGS